MAGKTNHREKALNHKLHIRLWQASDAIRASRQKALKKMGVTVEQAGVLHIIQRLGNRATAYELAKALFRKPPAMTILLRRMEKKDLIVKTPDPGKKNIVRLSLTRKGRELYNKTLELTTLDNIFKKLTINDRRRLCADLEMLRDNAWEGLDLDVASLSELVSRLDL